MVGEAAWSAARNGNRATGDVVIAVAFSGPPSGGRHGLTSVTYLAGPEAGWADGMRWVALMEGCHQFGLRFHRVGPCNVPTMQAGYAAAVEVLAQGSTAVIAYNDVMAVGVIKGMHRAGVRVPQDVSVIGFDNVVASEIVEPEVTTVAAPYRSMGTTGVKNVIAALSGTTQSGGPIVLPVKLVVRGSTGQPRRTATALTRGTSRGPDTAPTAPSRLPPRRRSRAG